MKAINKIGVSLICGKLADLLLSPKTTLTTLLTVIGSPPWMVQLLVPLREAGSLLPQIVYANLLRRKRERHHFWCIGILLQIVCSIVILLSLAVPSGVLAGALVLFALTIFALARALSSLIMKDIQGQHVNQGSRGKLIGSASTISSVLSLMVGLFALLDFSQQDITSLFWLGVCAVLAQVLSLIALLGMQTRVEQNDHSSNTEAFQTDLWVFIIARSLLAHSALVAPLFVLAYSGDLLDLLGLLIITQAMASLLSSFIWGRLSDVSAKLSIQIGAIISLIACMILICILWFSETLTQQGTVILGLYLLLSIGHNGIRTGRKIYAVDVATDHQRTHFVAVSNSVVGVVLLSLGALYGLLAQQALILTLGIMTTLLLMGIIVNSRTRSEKSD